jgi:hypothetical protein
VGGSIPSLGTPQITANREIHESANNSGQLLLSPIAAFLHVLRTSSATAEYGFSLNAAPNCVAVTAGLFSFQLLCVV